MLITDPSSAVRAVDEKNLAAVGILDHGSGRDLARPRPRREGQDAVDAGDTIITAGSPAGGKLAVALPARTSRSAFVSSVGQNDTDIYKQIQVQPFVDLSSLESVLVLIPKAADAKPCSTVILDASRRSRFALRRGARPGLDPRRLLAARRHAPTSCSSSLHLDRAPARLGLRRRRRLRRGLLIDIANLGTLGFTSLLLTLAGFWTGRYGETTARDRFHAPFVVGRGDHRALRVRHARAATSCSASPPRPAPTSPGCRRRCS